MLKPFSLVVANLIAPHPDKPGKAIVDLQVQHSQDPNAPQPERVADIRLTVDLDEALDLTVGKPVSVTFG